MENFSGAAKPGTAGKGLYTFPMKSVIVGTAGHIDHGKTALVKALTGIDADRLEEEKRRGITIDIGFAHLELPGPGGERLRLGFVDVPGHERFVRNMLAGVGGIDLVLLVIAADESIKPQTREHFDILGLLAVQRGITVLTKADLVHPEMLEVVKLEVGEFLHGSFLDAARAPMVAVSSLTGAGLEELKAELVRVAAEVPARDRSALARLPIDRVFTMKGFGTVVTGTLISGTIRREDELELFPGGKRVRVRGVQVHGEAADEAWAGQRTALNLAGMAVEELSRGMVLTTAGAFRATAQVDVQLTMLDSARPLKHRAQVHFHAHTFETVAEVAFYGEKQAGPGSSRFARLKLAAPALLAAGDHFIVRQFSPVITIGGGKVLDAFPLRRRSSARAMAQALEELAQASPEQTVALRLARQGRKGLSLAGLVVETGWAPAVVASLVKTLVGRKQAVRAGDVVVSAEAFAGVGQGALQAVSEFHAANPLVAGLSRESLRERLGVEAAVFSVALESLVQEKKLEASGEMVRLPGRGVTMKDEESESKEAIEREFAAAGLKVPALKDVLAGLKVDRGRAQKLVTLLLRDKVLLKVSEDLVFHHTALEHLRAQLAGIKSKSPKIDVTKFKELTGVSRKYAIPLLEYLDRERVTKRVGDERVIL